MKRSAFLLILLAATGSSCAHTQEVAQRIERITAALPPPMVKAGSPRGGKSLADTMHDAHASAVSVAVIHNGRIEWAKAFGTLSPGGASADADTLFQAGSISKPVSALAALRLVQQGKLSLDRDVNEQLTSWKLPSSPAANGKPVTLRELLSHTAGLNVHGFPGYAAGKSVPTLVQVLEGMPPAVSPPLHIEAEPGSDWRYSGGGFVLMQQLVTDVTHQPFATFAHNIVLEPLGMTRSTFEQPLPADQKNFAVPIHDDGKLWDGGPHTYPERTAAGLWTTPTDLAKFLIELQLSQHGKANHVLNEPATKQMLTPGKNDWGLGISLGGAPSHRFFGHGGSNAGYESLMTAFFENGDGAAIMTNVDGGSDIAEALMRSIAVEYGWPEWGPRVVKTIPTDPESAARYAGVYVVDPHFDLTMKFRDGNLIAQGTNQPELTMWAQSKTLFTMASDVDIQFVTDAHGTVTGLNILQNGKTRFAPRK